MSPPDSAATAAIAALVLTFALWPRRDPGSEGVAAVTPSGEPAPGSVVSADDLLAVDQALFSGRLDHAQQLVTKLMGAASNDARLWWRQGRIHGARDDLAEALIAYGKALEHDASLLDDGDFFAELAKLLREESVRGQAVDLAPHVRDNVARLQLK